jgi:hypothetical protein
MYFLYNIKYLANHIFKEVLCFIKWNRRFHKREGIFTLHKLEPTDFSLYIFGGATGLYRGFASLKPLY